MVRSSYSEKKMDPTVFRIRLLMRSKDYNELVRSIRERVGLPSKGFKRMYDYFDWIQINNKKEEIIDGIYELAKRFNLSANYHEYLKDYIGVGSQDLEQVYIERTHTYLGTQVIHAMRPDFNRVFIEIFPETTIKDLSSIFRQKKKDRYLNAGIDSIKLRAFRRLATKYKTPTDPLRSLRLFELKQKGLPSKEIAVILRDEFPDHPKLTPQRIDKKYSKLSDFLTPKRHDLLKNL